MNKPARIQIDLPTGTYQQELFDPVQTHAVYGLTKDTYDGVKAELKSKGATYFRRVKCIGKNGLMILCYKTVASIKK